LNLAAILFQTQCQKGKMETHQNGNSSKRHLIELTCKCTTHWKYRHDCSMSCTPVGPASHGMN